MMLALAISGLVMLQPAAPAAAPAGESFILQCQIPGRNGGSATQRTFRISRGVFQEWRAPERTFGPNLCQSFPCRTDRDRLEGVISSASVMLTVKVDPKTRTAAWRTTGASGNAATTGACRLQQEPKGGYRG